ncbi:protein phosphatase 2C domain-containing protein [Pontibacillus sp. HMF3514]|uniref:protein phosphatase 2C domain-containing protein n=1 Tax=Pontibacillus sp. HMF3514 TaxID=2692425 RepID=UPI001F234415|nr:protein phosphatase 2C domain-containing protein [Pontibacillus sp. HMF3514]
MKIETITYKGVGELNEDSLILNDDISLYGVADGVSSLVPFKSDDNLTGGYIASNEVKKYFEHVHHSTHLSQDLFMINQNIREKMEAYGIDMVKKEKLWGTAVAMVKISERGVEFIQTGDCMILVVYQDDHVRPLTHLQTEHLENKALNRWIELVQNGVNAREDLMNEVKDILISNRMKSNTPEGYGVLNGEESAIDYTEYGEINKVGLKHLILMTDGLFLPLESVPANENYWDYVAQRILQKGLKKYANELMELEESDPECLKYPRFKKSDDKAGLVITFKY